MNFWICCCCGSVTVPARAIICFCVQKVDSPISTTIVRATLLTMVGLPSSRATRSALLLNAAPIGAPKTLA